MKLSDTELTIHLGDKVSFYEIVGASSFNDPSYVSYEDVKDALYITGKVVGITESNHIELLVKSEFAHHTIPAKQIHSINNLCVSMNGFIGNLKVSVGI